MIKNALQPLIQDYSVSPNKELKPKLGYHIGYI